MVSVNDEDDGMFKAGGGRMSGDRCIVEQQFGPLCR